MIKEKTRQLFNPIKPSSKFQKVLLTGCVILLAFYALAFLAININFINLGNKASREMRQGQYLEATWTYEKAIKVENNVLYKNYDPNKKREESFAFSVLDAKFNSGLEKFNNNDFLGAREDFSDILNFINKFKYVNYPNYKETNAKSNEAYQKLDCEKEKAKLKESLEILNNQKSLDRFLEEARLDREYNQKCGDERRDFYLPYAGVTKKDKSVLLFFFAPILVLSLFYTALKFKDLWINHQKKIIKESLKEVLKEK